MGSCPPTSVNYTQDTLCSPNVFHRPLPSFGDRVVLSVFSSSELSAQLLRLVFRVQVVKKNKTKQPTSWIFADYKIREDF